MIIGLLLLVLILVAGYYIIKFAFIFVVGAIMLLFMGFNNIFHHETPKTRPVSPYFSCMNQASQRYENNKYAMNFNRALYIYNQDRSYCDSIYPDKKWIME